MLIIFDKLNVNNLIRSQNLIPRISKEQKKETQNGENCVRHLASRYPISLLEIDVFATSTLISLFVHRFCTLLF